MFKTTCFRERNLTKKGILIILSFLFVWSILTIFAVTWETRYDWPDNVHIDYGFPLVWSTQTLSTIIGPVNLWTVDIPILIMTLSLWLGIMLIITSIMFYFFNKK
jgi:vacuolar-type H+-ATPase subunit I/STV1